MAPAAAGRAEFPEHGTRHPAERESGLPHACRPGAPHPVDVDTLSHRSRLPHSTSSAYRGHGGGLPDPKRTPISPASQRPAARSRADREIQPDAAKKADLGPLPHGFPALQPGRRYPGLRRARILRRRTLLPLDNRQPVPGSGHQPVRSIRGGRPRPLLSPRALSQRAAPGLCPLRP